MQVVAERFKAEVPAAFDGDGVAFLQTIYRNPHQPTELRMDAAAKAARYERPALQAAIVRDVTPAVASEDEAKERLVELFRKLGAIADDDTAANA